MLMTFFRTIFCLVMACLVLMASSSFYVGVHYCAGEVKAMALLSQADGCGHDQLPPCHRKAMEGCCHDEQVVHESQELKSESTTIIRAPLSSSEIIFNTMVVGEVIPAFEAIRIRSFPDHPPALSGHDIIISLQSLLI